MIRSTPGIPTVAGHTLTAQPIFDEAMALALDAAGAAAQIGEVPVGAAVVRVSGQGDPHVISVASNRRETTGDPTAHAEVLVLRAAAAELGRWRLDDCVLVVTLEPCPMCAGAAWAARIGGVVFGAVNNEAGSTGSLYHLGADPRLNHEFPTLGGVRGDDCSKLLVDFFGDRRLPAEAAQQSSDEML